MLRQRQTDRHTCMYNMSPIVNPIVLRLRGGGCFFNNTKNIALVCLSVDYFGSWWVESEVAGFFVFSHTYMDDGLI